MVEVFKTTVNSHVQAFRLSEAILHAFPGYRVNFDLHDCDNILRVENTDGGVDTCGVISLIAGYGSFAEMLGDEMAEWLVKEHLT